MLEVARVDGPLAGTIPTSPRGARTQAHRHTGTQVSQTSRLPPSANHAWRSCRQGCAVGVEDTKWCPYFQLGVTVYISELVIGFYLKVKLG